MDPQEAARFYINCLEDENGCWIWWGQRSSHGYGQFRLNGRRWGAHRLSYEHEVGPIPAGYQIDHLCRVPACVNPDHLEPVTPRENYLRGYGLPAKNARKQTCALGHEFKSRPTGWRYCPTCQNARKRERRRLGHGRSA